MGGWKGTGTCTACIMGCGMQRGIVPHGIVRGAESTDGAIRGAPGIDGPMASWSDGAHGGACTMNHEGWTCPAQRSLFSPDRACPSSAHGPSWRGNAQKGKAWMRDQGLGISPHGSGFGVNGLSFRVEGLEFGVQG